MTSQEKELEELEELEIYIKKENDIICKKVLYDLA